MKTKILSALKERYKQLGLGDEYLGSLAETISNMGVVTDDNLQKIIDSYEPILKAKQSEDDRTRRELAETKAKLNELSNPKPQQESAPKADEEPEWFKKYKEEHEKKIDALIEESNRIKKEKESADRATFIANKAKELGIPDWRIGQGFVVSPDMDETAISNHLSKIKQDIVGAGLDGRDDFRPSTDMEAIKDEAKRWAEGL